MASKNLFKNVVWLWSVKYINLQNMNTEIIQHYGYYCTLWPGTQIEHEQLFADPVLKDS